MLYTGTQVNQLNHIFFCIVAPIIHYAKLENQEHKYLRYLRLASLKEMPKRYVASLRKIIPDYQSEGMLWEQLMSETAPLNMQIANPADAIAIFHDEGFKESDVDVEIQMTVNGNYTDTENVVFKTVEPIQMISVTFKGGYEQTPDVSEAIANWAKDHDSQYEFGGAMFNIYPVSPAMEKNPENWVTEACCPVKKK